MYLPSELSLERKESIKGAFVAYSNLVQQLCEEYGAVPHWAKLEVVGDDCTYNERIGQQLRSRYDLELFEGVRALCDPHEILMNNITTAILKGHHAEKIQPSSGTIASPTVEP